MTRGPDLIDPRCYMSFYLFQAGERLPPEADERLGRQVKRRFDALEDLL